MIVRAREKPEAAEISDSIVFFGGLCVGSAHPRVVSASEARPRLYLRANISLETAENEASKVCRCPPKGHEYRLERLAGERRVAHTP